MHLLSLQPTTAGVPATGRRGEVEPHRRASFLNKAVLPSNQHQPTPTNTNNFYDCGFTHQPWLSSLRDHAFPLSIDQFAYRIAIILLKVGTWSFILLVFPTLAPRRCLTGWIRACPARFGPRLALVGRHTILRSRRRPPAEHP